MASRKSRGNKALADAKAAVVQANELVNQLRAELKQCREDHARASVQASANKGMLEAEKRRGEQLDKNLRHQERLVRTLTDALADKYYPLPTEIKVGIDYRVAKGAEHEQ